MEDARANSKNVGFYGVTYYLGFRDKFDVNVRTFSLPNSFSASMNFDTVSPT